MSDEEMAKAYEQIVAALEEILRAEEDFRSTMPANWEGDPLHDACEKARALASLKDKP